VSSRTAAIWVVLFLALAFGGGGGFDLFTSDDDRSPVQASSTLGRVERIVDGDTVKVRLQDGNRLITVRYIGVDTPESVAPGEPVQCFATHASRFNERLVTGRRVRLRTGRERTDRFGRTLAYVYLLEGRRRFVNAELLRRGYARTLEIPPNTDFADRFDALEQRARDARRGLWRSCENF
jgi:micrococcal nuclease